MVQRSERLAGPRTTARSRLLSGALCSGVFLWGLLATHYGVSSDLLAALLLLLVVAGAYLLPARLAWIGAGFALLTFAMTIVPAGGGSAGFLLAGFAVVTAVVVLAVSSLRSRLAAVLASLEREARTDELTGLPNRRGFEEVSAHELARCRRSGLSLSLLVARIDRFGETAREPGTGGG
ncbi:MAG: GGDEF domain-containing protein, partial [Micromonosporaceae bacterium]|nr:GGDEF domain-containing protein [Micromonosporaceae bacterium]